MLGKNGLICGTGMGLYLLPPGVEGDGEGGGIGIVVVFVFGCCDEYAVGGAKAGLYIPEPPAPV